MKIRLIIIALIFGGSLNAQTSLGTLMGQIIDESGVTIPAASVFLEGQGIQIPQKTDLDGRFKYTALKPGLYTLKSVCLGKDTTAVGGIEIKPNGLMNLGHITLNTGTIMGKVFEYKYTRPLIAGETGKIEIPTTDIDNSPFVRNPKELFAAFNSDIQIPEGTSDMIIRGSRPGDVIYYVDGVKSGDLNGVPGAGIASMTGYTGGIPAKYGDTTGGVVILETKSYFDLYYAWKAK